MAVASALRTERRVYSSDRFSQTELQRSGTSLVSHLRRSIVGIERELYTRRSDGAVNRETELETRNYHSLRRLRNNGIAPEGDRLRRCLTLEVGLVACLSGGHPAGFISLCGAGWAGDGQCVGSGPVEHSHLLGLQTTFFREARLAARRRSMCGSGRSCPVVSSQGLFACAPQVGHTFDKTLGTGRSNTFTRSEFISRWYAHLGWRAGESVIARKIKGNHKVLRREVRSSG